MSIHNKSEAEAELQRGFAAMQPAGLSLLDVSHVHFIEQVPPLNYSERMARLKVSLYKLAREAPEFMDGRRLFRETTLRVEAGVNEYELTLIAPETSKLSEVSHIQVPEAQWQKLLREPLLTAFVPVAEPDGHGWFISSANNPLEKHVRHLIREEACAFHKRQRDKLAHLFPH